MYVNFLSTYSDKKSCHTSTTLQTSIARFVSDSWSSCYLDQLSCHRSRGLRTVKLIMEIPAWKNRAIRAYCVAAITREGALLLSADQTPFAESDLLALSNYVVSFRSVYAMQAIDLIELQLKMLDLNAQFNPLEIRGNYSATSKIWSWYTSCWWVGCCIWYNEEGSGWGSSPPRPLLATPNVAVHPSRASVPIIVLLYNGPLLCGVNLAIKG